jgi:hypothetical protein
LTLTVPDAQNYVGQPQSGQSEEQERKEAKRRRGEMRQKTSITQRMGDRTPRAEVSTLFPVPPMSPLLPPLCPAASTQTGTPFWTHHPVTHSKQKIGVESERNSIPAALTISASRSRESESRFLMTRRRLEMGLSCGESIPYIFLIDIFRSVAFRPLHSRLAGIPMLNWPPIRCLPAEN